MNALRNWSERYRPYLKVYNNDLINDIKPPLSYVYEKANMDNVARKSAFGVCAPARLYPTISATVIYQKIHMEYIHVVA